MNFKRVRELAPGYTTNRWLPWGLPGPCPTLGQLCWPGKALGKRRPQLGLVGSLACLSKFGTLKSNPFASKESDVGSDVFQRVKWESLSFPRRDVGLVLGSFGISPSWREWQAFHMNQWRLTRPPQPDVGEDLQPQVWLFSSPSFPSLPLELIS